MLLKKNNKERKKYPELMPLWIAVFIDILGFYIIIPFLPSFITIFNTTPLVIGVLLATNAFFTLIFAPLWGKFSDKYGRKPALLLAQAGTFSAFLILTFSNSLELIFISRIVDGVFGGNWPLAKAIVSDSVPPKDRGLQMTNIGVIHVLAGLIGPGVGGILSIFLVLGQNYPIATPGFVASGLSLCTMIVTLLMLDETWPKELREKHKKENKVKIKIRENKDASYLLTQYAFHTFSFTMYVTTLTIFMGIVIGLSALEIGIVLTISGVFRAIMRFTVFKPTLRLLGENKMTKLGLLIVAVTFFLVGFVRDVISLLILMLIVSYGVSISRGLLISRITQVVRPNEMGKINGYTTTLDSLAQIAGPIAGTFILSAYNPVLLGFGMGLLALVAFFMVFKKIVPLHDKQHDAKPKKLNN
ncbi:MAG: MFS transporter [Candidatus Lokiarchaeota archaeon]|nr:MFS transporter [Candidatus Lokiarchaeota archaeon]MBD3342329.1 MFS transporter [Candidatus Lokiarchaeota archaeon]